MLNDFVKCIQIDTFLGGGVNIELKQILHNNIYN